MEKSFWKELWLLLIFTAIGLLPCLVTSVLAFMVRTESVLPLHFIQWSQTVFVMILPPIFWYIFRVKGDVLEGYGLKSQDWRASVLAVIFIICSIPAFESINYLNSHLPLPESIKEAVRVMGEANDQTIRQMISIGGVGGWVELILLMSIGTAIGEELMFRGALLKCFSFTRLNQHWVAVLVGLVFSIIHFEPYGFVDRWILGSFLCYLVIWTGSLWPSIILHATNNLIALIQYKCFDMTIPAETNELEFSWYLIVVSYVVSGVIVWLLYKRRKSR